MSKNDLPSKTIQSITFDVADVTPANKLLPEKPYDEIIRDTLNRTVEAFVKQEGQLLTTVGEHPFVHAVYSAYSYHQPLVISPDHIWLLICQGFAKHVHVNAEKLRHRFVEHAGKREIVVERPEFMKGSPENVWEEIFSEFTEKLQASLVGDFYELLIPTFSTTSVVEKAAYEISMMYTFSPYYDFTMSSLCGIPSVTLEGSPADWRSILERVERLGAYGIRWWTKRLAPILEELVHTSEGQINREFWGRIYSQENKSGGPFITGWVLNFFPYVEKFVLPKSIIVPNQHLASEQVRITIGELGCGQSFAPFTWQLPGNREAMEFVTGFVGVTQNHTTKALRPEIGWAICYARTPNRKSRRDESPINVLGI
jgi:hypothetical protein